MQGGVLTERCYGCGRCFPICPYDKISKCSCYVACVPFLLSFSVVHRNSHPFHNRKQVWHSLLASFSCCCYHYFGSCSTWTKIVKIDLDVVTYIRDANATAELIKRDDVDALEIHTSARYSFFYLTHGN